MSPTIMILRLAIAAMVAGLAAGILLVLLLTSGTMLADWQTGWETGRFSPRQLLWTLRFGVEGGFVVAVPAAFLAGAAMSALGRRWEAARSSRAWGAAGACVGTGFWLLAELAFGLTPVGRMSVLEAGVFAAFLVTGAGSALSFRALMWLTRPFDTEEEAP